MSHNMLRGVLPAMRNWLHDVVETVRVAFVNLLLRVKRFKTIKVGLLPRNCQERIEDVCPK